MNDVGELFSVEGCTLSLFFKHYFCEWIYYLLITGYLCVMSYVRSGLDFILFS